MIRLLHKLAARLGYTLVRTDELVKRSPELAPVTALDSINAARFLYFQNLMNRTRGVAGDIVECGVGMGRSFLCMSLLVKITQDARNLWGFDSFEGFPEPSQSDESPRQPRRGEYAVTLDSVHAMLARHLGDDQFVRSRVTFVKGFFDTTLSQYPHKSISLLNLDVDLYDSYKVCLEKLYPLLSAGGIVTFDEYVREGAAFPGAVKAINEFFRDKGVSFERDPSYGKYFIVKP